MLPFLCIFVGKWLNNEFMEKWLSFIVPVYNVEDYLSECVDSLLNQDVPSELYEIILYDDGSTDGSLRIAQKYGADYANIRVLPILIPERLKLGMKPLKRRSANTSGLLTAMISLLPACCLVFMRRPAKAIWTC